VSEGTDLLERVELDINLDETIPCVEECEREAEWRGRRPCCDCSDFLCDEHYQEVREIEDIVAGSPYPYVCKACRAPYKPNIWVRI